MTKLRAETEYNNKRGAFKDNILDLGLYFELLYLPDKHFLGEFFREEKIFNSRFVV